MRKPPLLLKDPVWMKILLILISFSFLSLIVIIPLLSIFLQAFAEGWQSYLRALSTFETISAIKLSLLVTMIVVPINILFGLVASWLISKFSFPGRQLLIASIDLPLSVSPVIAGLIFVLLFNSQTTLGHWFIENGFPIIYAIPGIVLATLFVTSPYVVRELIPLLQQLGNDEEEAAHLLGASGLRTFMRVTLPNIKWGLLYGTILCTARALGEFGAVSVVSGNIQGLTNTLPLHVEVLYNEYKFTQAFAVASLLTFIAVVTLTLKTVIELKTGKIQRAG